MAVTERDTANGGGFILSPSSWRMDPTIGVIWVPGTGQLPETDVIASTSAAGHRLAAELARRFTVHVGHHNGNAGYGNSASIATIEDARTLLAGRGCTRFVLIGLSQGHACVVAAAAAQPSHFKAVISVVGVSDLQWSRVNNGLLRAAIDIAYGVTYPAALPGGSETADKAANLAANNIAWRGWAGSVDAVAPVSVAQTFATNANGTLTVVPGGNHDASTWSSIDPEELATWIYDCCL